MLLDEGGGLLNKVRDGDRMYNTKSFADEIAVGSRHSATFLENA